MTTEMLEVPTSTGGKMALEGERIGPVFVHKHWHARWRLTHVGTGLRFPWEWSSRKKAVAAARRINGHCDLDALVKAEAGRETHSKEWAALGRLIFETGPLPRDGAIVTAGSKIRRDGMAVDEMRKFAGRR